MKFKERYGSCYVIILILCSLIHQYSFSQQSWSKSFKSSSDFIENKGQFSFDKMKSEDIQYVAQVNGINLVFSLNGLSYVRHTPKNKVKHDNFEEKILEKKLKGEKNIGREIIKEREREAKQKEFETAILSLKWMNSNPNCKIFAEQEVQNVYTYYLIDSKTNIVAHAYKKIVYKNIYDHIDIEYLFVEGKEGFKYNIILHPGANPSDIVMNYVGVKPVMDEYGNAQIPFQNKYITDHAPQTVYEDGTKISSHYKLNGNTIMFQLEDVDSLKKIIIDPWTITPDFNGGNGAYDVEYDNLGNLYVHGGGELTMTDIAASQIKKYDSNGNLLWTHTPSLNGAIADIAVNRSTGNCYYTFMPTNIYELSTLGLVINSYIEQNPNVVAEFFNVKYNQCTNKVYVGCGASFDYMTQIYIFSEDLSFHTKNPIYDPMNFGEFGNIREFVNSSVDDQGEHYYTIDHMPDLDNIPLKCNLIKCDVNNFSGPLYKVETGYKYSELSSISFQGKQNWSGPLNGSSVSQKYLYSSDGYTLKKWDNQNGTLIDSVIMSPTQSWLSINGNNPVTKIISSGLANDDYENIYAGFEQTVRKYGCSLDFIDTYSMPDSVYDVQVNDVNTKMYVCGKNFVSQVDLSTVDVFNVDHTEPTNCGLCDGKAFLSTNLCQDEIDNFSISWNTTPPQTSDTAFNLCPGTYTVTVTKVNCSPLVIYTGTVTVNGSLGPAIVTSLTATTVSCTSNNGTATVAVSGGTPGFTYSWNTSPVQTGSTATNLSSGMITVTVNDASGCSMQDSILVPSENDMELSMNASSISCLTNIGSASVAVQNGFPSYSYLWSNGETTSSISVSSSGMQYVTITDQNGCISTDSIMVDPAVIPTTVASANTPLCEGETLSLSASNSSVANSIYSWTGSQSFSDNSQNTQLNNATVVMSGDYVVTVLANDCSSTDTVSVVINPVPSSQPSSNSPVCSGDTIYLFASDSPVVGTAYSWTGPDSFVSSQQTPFISNSTVSMSGSYVLTASANACSSSSSLLFTVNPIPDFVLSSNSPVCEGSDLQLNAVQNSAPGASYQWTGPSGFSATSQNITIDPVLLSNNGTYILIVFQGNCSKKDSLKIIVNPIPTANFIADTTFGCSPLAVSFTNLSNPIGDSVVWDFGDSQYSSVLNNVSHVYTSGGNFDVKLTCYAGGCNHDTTFMQYINVYDNAQAIFEVSSLTAEFFDPQFSFYNESQNANSYAWDFNDGSFSTVTDPIHTYMNEASDYEVILIANNEDNCPDTTKLLISVIEPLIFYVPNSFTPDGNSFNEIFQPVFTSGFDPNDFELLIYNRWGEVIFTTKNVNEGWNGTFKGNVVEEGVYTWKIEFKDKFNDKRYLYTGHINLLK